MPTRPLVRGGVAGLCVVGVVCSLITYRSEDRLSSAYDALFERRWADATRLFEDSRPLNPDRSRESGEAAALFGAGRRERAVELLRDAIRSEPENADLWIVLARMQSSLGRRVQARRSYARARELDPRLPDLGVPPPL